MTQFAIIEGYPEGDTWTHYFHDVETAKWNLRALREAHPWREYVPVGFDEDASDRA
uniref:hypothetical protein n=1 Tax=Microbacterium proteolyticum TaxID=1572644 RepID=UPI00241726C7|nr:hypothetical protein [Microbacterium proteolyticum]